MQYAKTHENKIVDAVRVQEAGSRREQVYYCPECDDRVTFILSQRGENHFRHRVGHEVCVLSALVKGGKITQRKHWVNLLQVKTVLTEIFTRPDIEQRSSIHWETDTTTIYLLPFYYPERQLIIVKQNATAEGKDLLLLVARMITKREVENISTYGHFRIKSRAIYQYAATHSIPPRLVITTGYSFYQLMNRRRVWSQRYEQFCRTVFDFDYLRDLAKKFFLISLVCISTPV